MKREDWMSDEGWEGAQRVAKIAKFRHANKAACAAVAVAALCTSPRLLSVIAPSLPALMPEWASAALLLLAVGFSGFSWHARS